MVAQRHLTGDGGPDQESQHFVVVFPGHHRPWAAWIARRLEAHGHRVTSHRWDPDRDQSLEVALGDLLLARGRVLLVLSDWFFQLGPRREGDSRRAGGFVPDDADRFAALNLTNRALLPATAVLEPVDLWGIGEQEAERRLLVAALPGPGPPRADPVPSPSRYPSDPPAVWGEVPRRNARFTGQEVLLDRVQESLADVEPGASVCALVGMSGWQDPARRRVRPPLQPRLRRRVVGQLRPAGTQRDRFRELAPALGLRRGSEPGERIRAVRDALRRGDPHSRWQVIFDGWEDVEEAAASCRGAAPAMC